MVYNLLGVGAEEDTRHVYGVVLFGVDGYEVGIDVLCVFHHCVAVVAVAFHETLEFYALFLEDLFNLENVGAEFRGVNRRVDKSEDMHLCAENAGHLAGEGLCRQ